MFDSKNLSRRCLSVLLIVLISVSELVHSLHINLSPRLTVNAVLNGFQFHNGANDHFKLLEFDGDSLLVGARDAVYNLSSSDLALQQTLSWPSTADGVTQCKYNGKTDEQCHNFIRVLIRQKQGHLLVCGTNAFKPLCREYSLDPTNEESSWRYQMRREFSGYAISPWDPNHNSTFVYLPDKDELYAATVSDFTGSDPLIYRKPLAPPSMNSDRNGAPGDASAELRTTRNDLKCLNDPNFVSTTTDHDHVYFWFREVATEYSSCGKGVAARVGRVCRRDQGGPGDHSDTWTSFVKARLNCSIPGNYPFYFDELQATSRTVVGPDGDTMIYAVFTTLWEGLHASAICAYSMKSVRQIFDHGQFKVQQNPSSLWLPVTKHDLPSPRPGSCSKDSRGLNDNVINFIKKNSLMEQAVPNVFDEPIMIDTSLKIKFTQIAVDGGVTAVNGQKYDVIYLGTDSGVVYKLVNVANKREFGKVQTVLIEEIGIFPQAAARVSIRNLHISTTAGAGSRTPTSSSSSSRHSYQVNSDVTDQYGNVLRVKELKNGELRQEYQRRHLIVVTDNQVRSIALERCSNATTCGACVRLQDPYCAWDAVENVCLGKTHDGPWSAPDLIQSIESGQSAFCPKGEHFDNKLYAINELWPRRSVSSTLAPKLYSAQSLAAAILATLALASFIGFALGLKAARLRLFAGIAGTAGKDSTDASGGSSSASSYTYESAVTQSLLKGTRASLKRLDRLGDARKDSKGLDMVDGGDKLSALYGFAPGFEPPSGKMSSCGGHRHSAMNIYDTSPAPSVRMSTATAPKPSQNEYSLMFTSLHEPAMLKSNHPHHAGYHHYHYRPAPRTPIQYQGYNTCSRGDDRSTMSPDPYSNSSSCQDSDSPVKGQIPYVGTLPKDYKVKKVYL